MRGRGNKGLNNRRNTKKKIQAISKGRRKAIRIARAAEEACQM